MASAHLAPRKTCPVGPPGSFSFSFDSRFPQPQFGAKITSHLPLQPVRVAGEARAYGRARRAGPTGRMAAEEDVRRLAVKVAVKVKGHGGSEGEERSANGAAGIAKGQSRAPFVDTLTPLPRPCGMATFQLCLPLCRLQLRCAPGKAISQQVPAHPRLSFLASSSHHRRPVDRPITPAGGPLRSAERAYPNSWEFISSTTPLAAR